MNINWYPGHMKKTKEMIKDNLKLVDIVVELLDARIPISSKNHHLDEILGDKKRIVILNKYDLADPDVLDEWSEYYRAKGLVSIFLNSLNGDGVNRLLHEIKLMTQEQTQKMVKQGRIPRPIRVMIVGIPNVGKSSLINKLAGKKSATTGNRPGVTKGKQWIRLNKGLELFDTPGILWPKIDDERVGLSLAFTGAIKDEIMDMDDVAYYFIKKIVETYPNHLKVRYGLDDIEKETIEIMDDIARNRGCIRKGNMIDYEKVSRLIMDEFRRGKIGQISLESPRDMVIVEVDEEAYDDKYEEYQADKQS